MRVFLPLLTKVTVVGLLLASPLALLADAKLLLSVTGEGSVDVTATEAVISLGVEFQGERAETVQRQVGSVGDSAVAFLQSEGVAELRPNVIQLYPLYSSKEPIKQLGYRASLTISFRTPVSRAGEQIDALLSRGINRIHSVSVEPTDSQNKEGHRRALIQAVENALEEADLVLKSIGKKRREIVKIQLSQSDLSPRPLMMRSVAKDERETFYQLQEEEREVRASVSLDIEYE